MYTSNVVSYKGNGKRHATERRQKGHSVLTLVFPGSSSSQKGKLKHVSHNREENGMWEKKKGKEGKKMKSVEYMYRILYVSPRVYDYDSDGETAEGGKKAVMREGGTGNKFEGIYQPNDRELLL
ncbi:hypothetical protein KQX54_020351 [Cotesia glomerata]|uniref:Uncharacterized protein n=1 Tax=Cotesia glomerata TaxID=32391 RepID=A0AAV7J8L9_COTGL|nr:hypothetical protein KQX54_020351 [Cotesia glomerata]